MRIQKILVNQLVNHLKAKKNKKERRNKIDEEAEREAEAIKKLRQLV